MPVGQTFLSVSGILARSCQQTDKNVCPTRDMSNEPNKVICSMIGVTKAHDKKVVLKDIHLSYYYGAKIGVLGLNGSGKSTLLRILAQRDKNIQGQISYAPGYSIGFLEQEPQLEVDKTVRQVVEQGV